MTLLKTAAGLAALLAFAAAAGADAPADPAAAVCAKTACRAGGYGIAISVDKERYTVVPVSHSPYVDPDNDAIVIYPGETLVFQLPVAGDTIGTPVFVAEYAPEMPAEADPQGPPSPKRDLPKLDKAQLGSGVLVLSYGQMGRGSGMMLTLWQNLPQTVKLTATMAALRPGVAGYSFQPTSTCPLMPKLVSIENWQQPLGPIFLKNVRLLPAGKGMVCD